MDKKNRARLLKCLGTGCQSGPKGVEEKRKEGSRKGRKERSKEGREE